MIWTAPPITRDKMPVTGDERTLLEGWLEFHRQTLLAKCAGLTFAQLTERAAPPSGLTLLGLVRHMAEVERSWFRHRFAGEDVESLYCADPDNPDGDFDDVDTADPEADFATLQREVELARAAAAGRSLDETFYHTHRQVEMTLRWVYLHMIEEYARHNGHADLLRERLDGVTGI
ncbi:DinB family protein [Spongiactinospora sp. 9N601]|uniref:DinB family protein n=1 Tax=Spongiactinospora sp. 9N601 TaxID=3375149 RepID=UPI0037A33B14